jgi:uroporphyrinogen-III decarboxylase
MDHRQRMLAAIQGKPVDRIPWVPRLDIWYRANRMAGTLPSSYRNATLMEITDDLDFGYHAVIPDFQDLRSREDDLDRGLGIFNLHSMPYRTVLEDVRREVRFESDRTVVEYHTPKGTLRTVVRFDEMIKKSGATLTHIEEHAFQSEQNYPALEYLFTHARVEPNYEGYNAFAQKIGPRGLAVGFVCLAASPKQFIMRELMPVDVFFYELNDHPDEIASLVEAIGKYWEKILRISADCPAEVFLLGANYDASITYPPFFVQHIQPWLKKFAQMLHARGKYLLTHTDGENTGLLEPYLESNFDIADSICPAPMTKLTFQEVRNIFGDKITILGGIPSVALLPTSMPDRDFDRYIDHFLSVIGKGNHLILGISDTTPPGADFNRLIRLNDRIRAFGPVPGVSP